MNAQATNGTGTATNRRRGWLWVVAVLVIAAGAAAAYLYYQRAGQATTPPADTGGAGAGKGKPRGGGGALPVVTAPARRGNVNVYQTGLGSVTPLATVSVRSRVDGQLMKVVFREGQMVRAGELLAELDARPFQAQLLQAEGQMQRDLALLKNARIDLDRYKVLLQQDSVAEQQLATQDALVRQYEGTVKVDQAAVDTAKLQLTYCRITAPVGGRLGLRQVDVGNIVHAGDANGLVVITQLQPISVVFTIPEDRLPQVMAKLHAGERLAVDAYDRADKLKLAGGVLLTVDNQIDPATGTVKLKAQFANENGALFPSQFVNVHMLVDVMRDATMIPGAAVQRGTPGTFVYVVKPDSTVSLRKVKPGPAQGESVAIESGLAPGEIVVVDGADKLREGAKIEAISNAVREAAVAPRKGGGQALSPEERQRRWAEINARIDRGEFGEEIKKLSQEDRIKRMRELRRQRDGGGKQ